MSSEKNQDVPLGILLIATFWIFVGIFLLSAYSFGSQNIGMFIFVLLGTFFIFLGWGLISLKDWAYYTSLIIALIGLIPAVYVIPGSIYALTYGYSYGAIYAVFLAFIPMCWYLVKNMKKFVKKQTYNANIFCHHCGRSIPFDSNFCPYCEKKI